jgi:hypothetical protein
VFWRLLELCPTPEAAIAADTAAIRDIIAPLGLHNKRAVAVQRLSHDFVHKQVRLRRGGGAGWCACAPQGASESAAGGPECSVRAAAWAPVSRSPLWLLMIVMWCVPRMRTLASPQWSCPTELHGIGKYAAGDVGGHAKGVCWTRPGSVLIAVRPGRQFLHGVRLHCVSRATVSQLSWRGVRDGCCRRVLHVLPGPVGGCGAR